VVLEDWKIRVSLLWLIYEMALSAYMSLGTLMPNVLKDFIDTGELTGIQVTPEILLLFAVLLMVPLVMAFVTVALGDAINRWANIVVGVVFIVLELLELTDLVANPSAATTLIWIWKTVAPILIVWYAWKSKQKT
jgi:hypothetical protein